VTVRQSLTRLGRLFFFAVIVRITVLLILGLNVRHRQRLPRSGPAIIVANHNSHLDTLTLMSLFPLRNLDNVRPVAAIDYFLKTRLLRWFALDVIGIVPIDRPARGMARADTLSSCRDALDQGRILILFPEGSRGEPETPARFKSGVAHLVRDRPDVPVVPVFLHGLGKALPRGSAILVPFNCDIFVGERLEWPGSKQAFMAELEERMRKLADEGSFPLWT
jgi:1-acyl-sn-glycerol-3-phosphate acyltransferase